MTLPLLFTEWQKCFFLLLLWQFKTVPCILARQGFIGNWSRNCADFDHFPSNVMCCTKCIFFQLNKSITKMVTAIFWKLKALNEVHYIGLKSYQIFYQDVQGYVLYLQFRIICRLTDLLKDFQVGILLKLYYRINPVITSKIKLKKKNRFGKCTFLVNITSVNIPFLIFWIIFNCLNCIFYN